MSRFVAAVRVINAVTSPKTGVLLEQIAARVGRAAPDAPLFSAEERAKLQEVLALEADALSVLLDASLYIFETAGFAGASPEALAEELVAAGVDVDRASAFRDAWAAEGTAACTALRQKTLGGPAELTDSRMQVHLELGRPGATLLRSATAILELDVVGAAGSAAATSSSAASPAVPLGFGKVGERPAGIEAAAAGDSVGGVGETRLRVELSQSDLVTLLERLDRIQRQIDTLST